MAENFREDSQLYTWLYRIATNECLSYLEQQNASQPFFDEMESGLSNRSWRTSISIPTAGVETSAGIQPTPGETKSCVYLRYYDEMPYGEMSRVLDTSEGALKAAIITQSKK